MKVLRTAITATQILLASALVVLEYLSGYRAGVMQHLYYKKVHYHAGLYGQGNQLYHFFFLALCVFFVGWSYRGKLSTARMLHLAYIAILSLIFWFSYSSPFLNEFNIQAYLMIFLESVIIVESVWGFLSSASSLLKN